MQAIWLGAPVVPALITFPHSFFQHLLVYWLAGGWAIGVYSLFHTTTLLQRIEIGASCALQLWLMAFPISPLVFFLPACGYLVHAAVRAELTGRYRVPVLPYAVLAGLLFFAMTEDFRVISPGLHHSREPWVLHSVASDPVCVVLWLSIFWRTITLARTLSHLEAASSTILEPELLPQDLEPDDEETWHN